jgi:hypothetical protein
MESCAETMMRGFSDRLSVLVPSPYAYQNAFPLLRAYLEAGGTLENAQAMAAHESPRTTKLYDRTGDEITLDEVERITI